MCLQISLLALDCLEYAVNLDPASNAVFAEAKPGFQMSPLTKCAGTVRGQ